VSTTASQAWRETATTRRKRRAYWQGRLNRGDVVECQRCGKPIHPDPDTWDLGHDDRYPRDHDRQRPEHRKCNRRDGQAKTTAKRVASATRGSVFESDPTGTASATSLLSLRGEDGTLVEPDGFGVDDPVWDQAPWLDALREVPANATWPRFMTVPHPRAVGTLGSEFVAETLLTPHLRWFQQLWGYRLLEVDEDGRLVWDAWLMSMARQLGKSIGATELILWRQRQGDRFGGAQDCLHLADRLRTAKEVQRRARSWAKGYPGTWKVRESNESVEIEYLPDGSRWILRAGDAVYSFTGSLGIVDEGWKIKASIVEEGLAPTLIAREQAQLGLISTAHRRATGLMLDRRAAALEQLATGDGDLILEWSTPRSFDPADVAGWRLASPHWDARRERLIGAALTRALRGEESGDPDEPDPIEAFRAQWLNQWPLRSRPVVVGKGEPLVDEEAWRAAEVDDPVVGGLTVVVEDNRGAGAAAAAAGRLADGRIVVAGRVYRSLADAIGQARRWQSLLPGSRMLAGASLVNEPAIRPLIAGADLVGVAELRTGLALVRRLLGDGLLAHAAEVATEGAEGASDLTDQVVGARVTESSILGLSLVPGRSDLLRAAVWAVQSVHDGPATPRIH
jgi:hypothetical protein